MPRTGDRWPLLLDRFQLGSLIAYAVFVNFSISLTQIAQAVGVTCWLVAVTRDRSWGKLSLPVLVPILLYSLACVISTLTAVDPVKSLLDLKMILRVLTFFWVINCLGKTDPQVFLDWLSGFWKKPAGTAPASSRRDATWPVNIYANLLFAACAVSMFVAVFQAALHLPGIWVKLFDVEWPRIHGTFKHVFTFSEILMMVGVLMTARLLFSGKNFWLLGAFCLLLVCLGSTLSRHAWLGFAVSACILCFLRKPVLIVVPPLLIMAAFFLGPSIVAKRMNSMTFVDWSANQRLLIWKDGWDLIKKHPVTGCGLDCLHANSEMIQQYPNLKNYHDMHNNFFQVGVFTGGLGLITWLSIWVCYFLALFRRWRQLEHKDNFKWIFYGSFSVVVSFLIAGCFASNFFDSKVVLTLYFIMALPFVSLPGASPATASVSNR